MLFEGLEIVSVPINENEDGVMLTGTSTAVSAFDVIKEKPVSTGSVSRMNENELAGIGSALIKPKDDSGLVISGGDSLSATTNQSPYVSVSHRQAYDSK